MTEPSQVYGLTRTGSWQHILDRRGASFCGAKIFAHGQKVAHMRVCSRCMEFHDRERKRRGEA